MNKRCTNCQTEKPLADFYRDAAGRDGLKSCCKVCYNARQQKWRANNREKIAIWRRKDSYGITRSQYEALLDKQGGCCAICGAAFETTAPQVDHCHTTNRVRGLLCGGCNLGIGHLRDDPRILTAAISYLRANE